MYTLDTTKHPIVRELIGSMIGLARASDCNSLTDSNTWKILAEGLVATIPAPEISEIHSDAFLPAAARNLPLQTLHPSSICAP